MSLPAAAMWLDYKAPGFVLAAVRGTDAVALGFGETAAGFGVEPSGRRIVRIGSIAKVFAGQLLADFANGGKVRLADPAQRFPPGVQAARSARAPDHARRSRHAHGRAASRSAGRANRGRRSVRAVLLGELQV